jgi:PAS domain S-box-containing protein
MKNSPIRSDLNQDSETLSKQLDAMNRLYEISTLFIQKDNWSQVLTKIVETAIAISNADFGDIQLLDDKSSLNIVAHYGFPKWWLDFLKEVNKGKGVCETALESGKRVIVEDVEQSPIFIGTPALDIQLKAGVHAVQSTPIISRDGKPLGMFSTHFKNPHRPDDHEIRLLDLLANQVADIIERKNAQDEIVTDRNILNVILDNAEGPIFSIDCNYRYTRFNTQHAAVMKTLFDVDIEIGGNILDYHTNPEDRENAKINIDKAFKGETVIIETFAGDSPKNRQYFSIFHTPIEDASGKITGAAVYAQNHTERKKVEKALEKSEAQMREAQRLSKVGNWEWNLENDIVTWSDELYNIAGLDLKKPAPKYEEQPKFFTKESFSHLDRAVKNAFKTSEPYNILLEWIRVDGEHRWVDAHGEVIKNAEGQVIGLRGTVQDINEREKAEKALQESEKRYSEFFNNPIVGLGLCRVVVNQRGEPIDYIYLNFNDAFEEFTGLKREEIINKGVKEVLPDDADNLISIFGPVGINGDKIEVEVPIPTLNRIYNVSAYSPSHNHFIAIFSDITEQKNAEKALSQSQKLLQDIIDGFPSPIFVKDIEGRFLTVNKNFEELLGVKNEELTGKTDYDIITKELANFYRANDLKVVEEGKAISIDEEADLVDGHHTFIANKFPLYDRNGEPYGVGSISTDITERKVLEERMETTMKELKRSNKELERFAYVSSHDLQEPLRMVTLYSQLLEKRYKNILDKDADDFIEYIVENAKRMKQLIDDLLEYSRVTSQAKEFENVDFEKILNMVLNNLSMSITENNVKLIHESLPTLFADENQIIQVFQNLIINAIKFRDAKSPEIHISAEKGENEWTFYVSDNGIGIKPEHQKQIFDVFKRLHTRDEYPGTGIGLSIVQKIIKHHGGRIWVESVPKKGSTFYFTIPINE